MSRPNATFDGLAHSYDSEFTASPIARYLRQEVHRRLAIHFREGNTVLELGCGTGEDAMYLAQRKVKITATDASLDMLSTARLKTKALHSITFAQLDIQQLPDNDFKQVYVGAFANFGVLNVLQEWRTLARWLAPRIMPGGTAAFAIMSPLCIWEPLWHGAHGNFSTATRRWYRKATFKNTINQIEIPIYYPGIRHLTSDFDPYFARNFVRGLGITLPTSDAYTVIERRKTLFSLLLNADKTLSKLPWLAPFADHYWIEFRRTDVPAPQY